MFNLASRLKETLMNSYPVIAANAGVTASNMIWPNF